MSWVIWALLSSLFAAVLAESNKKYRLDAQMLNAWRSTFGALLFSAAFPFMIWPSISENIGFYVVAALSGIVSGGGMVMFFWLAARRTGRVTSMVLPLAAIGSYVLWWLMMPEERPVLTESPFKILLAIISALTICLALQKVRENDAGWESFMIVLPLGLALGAVDALTKWAMGGAYNIYALAVAFSFLSMVVTAGVAWIAAIPVPAGGRPMKFTDLRLLWGGFWCGFWSAARFLAGVFALSGAPNPTLPGIFLALTPMWLYGLNYLRREPDESAPIPGFLIMLGAVGLLLSTL
ncbi:MAG: hypothetical protein KBC88_00845 [Alphaproteobacteria bacterium]|jgi:hypothetical protein|nr:hypothetical protein [Alphaproteobacteria bacterium]